MSERPHLVRGDSAVARLIGENVDLWRRFTRHPFVERLAAGTLPEACFRHYLTQDYVFLVHFARAYALAAFKGEEIDEIRSAAATLNALIGEEMRLHVEFCAGFGLSEKELAVTREAPANLAYTRFVLDRGMQGDQLDLLTAMAPCVVGYGEIGAQLVRAPGTRLEGNPYRAWIEMYAGDGFAELTRETVTTYERAVHRRLGEAPWTSPRWAGLSATFAAATRLEIGFWAMGLEPAGA